MPENRRIAVTERLSRCYTSIARRINEFASELIIKTCKRHLSPTRGIEIEEPCYDPNDGTIHMDEQVDNEEYAETFKHELGHFIDDKLDCPSCKEAFGVAIQADLDQFASVDTGIVTLGKMLRELIESPALENRYLSDIFSAMFHEKNVARQWNAITAAYNTLGVPIYGHEVSYWTGKDGPEKAAQLEVFADIFAIFAENDIDTVRFVGKWFPNIINRFKSELERGVLHYG